MAPITQSLIKFVTGEYDVELVKRLTLVQQGIKEIENLEACINLLELSLANNAIRSIGGLASLALLQRLDLSSNRIEHIDNLEGLNALEHLDLRGNQIASVDEVAQLSVLPSLTYLFLRDYDNTNANPACSHPAYFTVVTRHLPRLHVLDGESIRVREIAEDHLKTFLEALVPDEEARKTPPIEHWIKDVDSEVELHPKSPVGIDHAVRANASDVLEGVAAVNGLTTAAQAALDAVLTEISGFDSHPE